MSDTIQSITDFIIGQISATPGKQFSDLKERDQRRIVGDVQASVREFVHELIVMVSADERPALVAKCESVSSNGDRIRVVLSLSTDDELRHALMDAAGKEVLIVVTNVEEHLGGEAEVEIDPDQQDIEQAISDAPRRQRRSALADTGLAEPDEDEADEASHEDADDQEGQEEDGEEGEGEDEAEDTGGGWSEDDDDDGGSDETMSQENAREEVVEAKPRRGGRRRPSVVEEEPEPAPRRRPRAEAVAQAPAAPRKTSLATKVLQSAQRAPRREVTPIPKTNSRPQAKIAKQPVVRQERGTASVKPSIGRNPNVRKAAVSSAAGRTIPQRRGRG